MTKTLTEAAKSGNKLDTLVALRDSIAANVEHCESGRDLAALSKRLMEVMNEIEQIQAAQVVKSNPIAKRKRRDA